MDIHKGKILVTGAGGFIGSHLVKKLIGQKCDVRAFVRYNSRNTYGNLELLNKQIKDVEVIAGDLRDRDAVNQAVKGCSLVFHLGALIGIPYSYHRPGDVLATNVGGTLNILDAVRDMGTEKLVVTSTSEVYGTPLYVPIDEKHPLQAQSPYAASKIAADKLTESYFNTYDLPAAIIRPFNTFGPLQSARAIIPTVVVQAISTKKIHLGSLEPRRDLMYVEDTVSGFIAVAEHENSIGKVINIGTGGDISIGELVELVQMLVGSGAKVVHDEQRVRPPNSEVQRLVCNYGLAIELLDWQPGFTLEEGLQKTVNWFKENLSRYKSKVYNI